MKKFIFLAICFVVFAALAFVVVKQVSFSYDIYKTSTIIFVGEAAGEKSQASASGLLFGGNDISKRITEFTQVIYGKSAAINLLQDEAIRREVAAWRSSGPLANRLVLPEEVNAEDMVAFLNKSLTLLTLHTSGILQLDSLASSKEMSARVLDGLIRYYIDTSRTNLLDDLVKQRDELFSELSETSVVSVSQSLSGQISQILTRIALGTADLNFGVRTIDAPYTQENPVNLSPVIQVGLAIFAGMILTFMVYILLQVVAYARKD